jgi:RepB DNA-primase from phage plasmid
VFLILETSPGSFQAWLAIAGSVEDGFARRLKNGTGADVNASGATRIAGSFNFKPKYAPNFPRVAIRQAQPGRMTDADELDRLGLVAAAEIAPDLPPFRAAPARISTGGNRKWPSYAICLDRAPLNSNQDGPSTSHADLAFCMTAITWGWSVEDTARRLMEEPESKAHRRGEKYTMDTARKAALFVKQRQPRPRRIAEHGRR